MRTKTSLRAEWRSNWPALVASTGAVGTGGSLYIYTAGYFVKPLEAALGWSRGEIALGSTIVMLTMAAAMPIAGMLTDRHGTRVVGPAAIGVFGLLTLVLASIPASLALYYGVLFAMALALSGTTAVAFAPIVVARFVRSRGLALGILMSGTALLLMPLAPVFQTVIGDGGWRAGYVMLASLALLVGFPCALFVARLSRPGAKAASQPQAQGITLRDALVNLSYWKMIVGVIAATLALGGFLHQLTALVSDKGLSVGGVGLIASLFVAMVMVGRTTAGLLLDLLHPPLVALGMMVGAASGALLLLHPEPSLVRCIIATCLVGCAMGAEGDLQAFFTARQFGLRSFSSIFGTMAMCTSAGVGSGALFFGAIHDATGSYDLALMLSAGLLLLSGVLFASLRKPGEGAVAAVAEPATSS